MKRPNLFTFAVIFGGFAVGTSTFAIGQSFATYPFVVQATSGGNLSSLNISGPISGTYTFMDLGPAVVAGAAYHQVVDVYYDSKGAKLLSQSATHAVDYNCNRGRHQDDLIALDDGKGGNVRFMEARLPSEPLYGSRPITGEGRIKALAAISKSPATIDATKAGEMQFAQR